VHRRTGWIDIVTAVVMLCSGAAPGRAQSVTTAEPDIHDSDPTRAVLLNIRPEIYKPRDGVTHATIIVRYDYAALKQRRWLPGRRGVIARLDAPLARLHFDQTSVQAGLGDLYGQLLLVPYFTRGFAVVAGTGLVMPTATNPRVGGGKWVLAPAAGPVWFLPRHGMVFVKLQDFIDIAGGEHRPPVHFFLLSPTIVRVFKRHWWLLADSEARIDWTRNGRTGVKSGMQFGRAIAPGIGVWAKPEVWWGPNRDGLWNVKLGIVWYR
jgi:hypothetical protein